MKQKTRSAENLDNILKAALSDDLPPEVAAGMRSRIAGFRAGIMKENKSPAARTWLFGRGLWATMAILMLIAGGLLQGFRSRTPLADRIALMKSEMSNEEPVRPPETDPANRKIAPEKRPALIPDEKETRS